MPPASMSVAERSATLKSIFNDFGITVHANSLLDRLINSEFGRGKRSELTRLLLDLQTGSDAGELAACIGTALEKNGSDPELVSIGTVMRERLPNLLHIVDIRQQTAKRIKLLEQLLLHFESRLAAKQHEATAPEQITRLLRMLASARAQLLYNVDLQAIGMLIEDGGVVFNLQALRRSGKIVRNVVPALIALDKNDVTFEQKINLCVHALITIGRELNDNRIVKAADIIDNVHWLAKVTLPKICDQATIEQALQNLNLSLGTITISMLRKKALSAGLTESEIVEVLYASKSSDALSKSEQELLILTQKNQQCAAACGFIVKLAREINCKELEQAGVASICLVSMRQTYCELKTNNINIVNFSESLGLVLSSVGVLTKNDTLLKIGGCIIEGVMAYSGLMAIPGGAYVAVPLAICAVLSKLMLNNRSRKAAAELPSNEIVLQQILSQIIKLQLEMRRQFAYMYNLLQEQHNQLLYYLDKGFASLENCLQTNNFQIISAVINLDNKIDALQVYLGREFADLYLEYIRDPIEEIEFFDRYGQGDLPKLRGHKLKLSMWLLFKASHRKVNGRDLMVNYTDNDDLSSYVALILRKTADYDAVLGLINSYVNIEFKEDLPEELPHVPTWLLAADKYIYLLNNYNEQMSNADKESQIVNDVQAIGQNVLTFVDNLAQNNSLWERLNSGLQNYSKLACKEIMQLVSNKSSLASYAQLCADYQNTIANKSIIAHSAPLPEQLELFDAISIDISELWYKHFAQHIPIELHIAESYGLGTLQISFSIDRALNNFAHLHMPYSAALLPDAARDVLYKIDISFKLHNSQQTCNLLTAWFAYDLCTVSKRFNEYYAAKFKYPLKHSRYLWISIDGLRNQVDGHGETDTQKLINYTRLAELYKTWWLQAQPVNDPGVLLRVQGRLAFNSQHATMLQEGDFFCLNAQNLMSLKFQLQNQIQQKILAQRLVVAGKLQASTTLLHILGKLDAYIAVVTAFKQLLNFPGPLVQLNSRFSDTVNLLTKPESLTTDFNHEFTCLLTIAELPITFPSYRDGVFYQKVSQLLIRLNLLLNSLVPSVRFGL